MIKQEINEERQKQINNLIEKRDDALRPRQAKIAILNAEVNLVFEKYDELMSLLHKTFDKKEREAQK